MLTSAAVFSIILAAAAAQSFPPGDLPTTCAAVLCPVGTVCREEPNENGVIQARCETPGECPSPDPLDFGSCDSECSHDVDCNGGYKCCKNSCGALTCQQPRPSCETEKCGPGQKCVMQDVVCVRAPCDPQPICMNVSKDWECPVPEPSQVGICAFACNSDSDCDGDKKCCENGCGGTNCRSPPSLIPTTPAPTRSTCATKKCGPGQKCEMQDVVCVRAPCYPEPMCVDIVVKPGRCPAPRPGDCANTCITDEDCKGSDKCCRNGCGGFNCRPIRGRGPTCENVRCGSGKKCVMERLMCIRGPCYPRPVCVDIEKPGKCPRPTAYFFFFFCFTQCRTDDGCPAHLKCCKTGCGTLCQKPVLPTCATIDCLPDHTCVMKMTCNRYGCHEVPECEPPKRCPFYPAWINPHCVPQDNCSVKDPESCSNGTICCSTDCGLQCVKPMEE